VAVDVRGWELEWGCQWWKRIAQPADQCMAWCPCRALDLSANTFNSTIPAGIGGLSRLVVLYLDQNQFSGTLPPEMSALTKLM
jgi:hypothetical protein